VKCRHRDLRCYAWLRPGAIPPVTHGAWWPRDDAMANHVPKHRLTCADCGAWLSLGPSNDAGCEVEIRAAQIIADNYMLWQEALGFECGDDAEPSGNREHHPSWHAGYLARCIATHEDER
jgi:hypothetical protein